MNKYYLAGAAALAFTLLCSQPAQAIPFSGTFAKDNDIQFFTFTLNSSASVSINTTSFGNQGAGNFVPWLSIWDGATGTTLGPTNSLITNPIPDSADASLTASSLPAGTYYGAVTVWHNYFMATDFAGALPANLDSTLFAHIGAVDTNDHFTYSEYSCTPAPMDYFMFDFASGCVSRGGNWAFDITGVSSASLYPAVSAPEPSTLALTLAGLAGIAPFARRRFNTKA